MAHAIGFSGLSVQGFVNLSNAAVLFFPLKPFDERTTKELSAGGIAAALNKKFGSIQDAVISRFLLPPCRAWATRADSSCICRTGAHMDTTNWRE